MNIKRVRCSKQRTRFMFISFPVSGFRNLRDTVSADIFPLERDDALLLSAEDARGLILLENDHVRIRIDLQRILFTDIQCTSQLDRKNNTPELVDFSNNACRFHLNDLPNVDNMSGYYQSNTI